MTAFKASAWFAPPLSCALQTPGFAGFHPIVENGGKDAGTPRIR